MSTARPGTPDHETWDELAVGWALHALEPEDEATFATHLPTCRRCRRTVAETSEVMAAMARDLPPAEPSERLRDRLRDLVEQTEQLPQAPRRPPEEPPSPAPPAATADVAPRAEPADLAPGGPDVVPLTGRHRSDEPGVRRGALPGAYHRPGRVEPGRPTWRRVLPNALVAAAVAAILALGTWSVVLSDARDDARAQAAQQSEIVQALLSPGQATIAPLDDSAGRSVATVIARNGQAQVVTEGLPLNDTRAQTYVLWGVRGSTPVPLGTFDVVDRSTDLRTVGSEQTGLGDFTAYAVSIEPGRQAPPTPSRIVANGEVTS